MFISRKLKGLCWFSGKLAPFGMLRGHRLYQNGKVLGEFCCKANVR